MALEIVASAVLQTVLQQSAQFLGKEALTASSVSDQFQKMQHMHRLISRFIDEVRKLENKTGDVKEALIQLWEVIYEAHDVLTDCIIRYEYRKDASCSSFMLQSVHDPFFLHQVGKKLEKINSRMKEKHETLLGLIGKQNISIEQGDSTQSWRVFQSQDINPEIVGLESDLKKIKEWMFKDTNEVNCIAIAGMGGLGKTTIAQKIFHDAEVREYFGGLAWVTVSRSFNAEKISNRILEKLNVCVSGINSSELMRNLQEELKNKKCLVVLDDVWHIDDQGWWFHLCSLFGKSSCIIITTRDLELPGKMGVKDAQIHKPDTLNDKDSRSLFSKMAFSSSNGECQDEFKEVRDQILDKCGGLPLAIKIIGSLLKNKSLSEWEEMLKSFHRFSKQGNIDQVKKTLRLSFNDLPGHLKHCLLCLSVYPEDYEITATSIIHWWIAEGLVEIKEHDSSHNDDLESSVMKSGYCYLSGLISRCLIEVVNQRQYDGTVTTFKIHDMVREMIISIAEEEAFCSFNDPGMQIGDANSYWLGFTDEMNDELLRKNSNKLRVLILMASRPVDFDKNSGLLLSLRVLDFSGFSNYLSDEHVKNLFKWIGSLRRLACLNLSGAEAVRELPSTIGKLLNLQLLILRGCTKLVKIHASITCLKRLIVLDLVSCPLQYFPRGLERLSCLQELTGFKVTIGQAKSRCCRLRELKCLTQLRVLRIVISTTDDATTLSESEPGILLNLHKLKVLAIDTGLKDQKHVKEMVDSLGVPPKLQELYLNGNCFQPMPKWFDPKKLSSLQYLCIENSDIVQLSNQVENNSCQSGWNVRGLSLKGLPKLQADWDNLIKVMPKLDWVDVSLCSNVTLKNFPRSIEEAGFWKKKQG